MGDFCLSIYLMKNDRILSKIARSAQMPLDRANTRNPMKLNDFIISIYWMTCREEMGMVKILGES